MLVTKTAEFTIILKLSQTYSAFKNNLAWWNRVKQENLDFLQTKNPTNEKLQPAGDFSSSNDSETLQMQCHLVKIWSYIRFK